jgi:GT2 family glycosyltransferase
MESMAPPVVVVIVTHDPGPWFETTLEAIGAQDYPEMSVLVLDAGSSEDPTATVGRVLPQAFVRRLEKNEGYGASANRAIEMVEGADFLVFCHDDVAPEEKALRLMVEEVYRSNAGVVGPKYVDWNDPQRLIHVGVEVDKTGAVVDRIERGEVDHGQHDGVRDVFCTSGGFTLVRRDLFEELGGFDEHLVFMGEDLDFCWRAQIAGARVIVAPEARVRHLELLAGGTRRPGEVEGSVQELQRRAEVHAALKAYGPAHRVRVLPQMVMLGAAEIVVLTAMGRIDGARAVAGAWRWNFGLRKEIRRERSVTRDSRRLADSEVRRLQMHGSARVTKSVRRAVNQGVRSRQLQGEAAAAMRARRRYRLVAWIVLWVVIGFGVRQLLTGGLPVLGGFLRMPSSGTLVSQFTTGQHRFGVGTTSPATPATFVLGIVESILFGSGGLLQTVLVFGCLPIGAYGAARLCKPLLRPWARFIAAACYVAFPLAYDDIAAGHLEALISFAVVPWFLLALAKASGLPPFSQSGSPGRAGPFRQVIAFGLGESLAVAFDPPAAVVALVLAAAVTIGVVVTTGPGALRAAGRVVSVAVGATVVTVVVLAPWSISVLAGGAPLGVLAGARSAVAGSEGWGALFRASTGPVATSPLVWGLVAAGLLPLLIGRDWRLAWAARAWICALAGCFFALASARGWIGGLGSSSEDFLPITACALSMSVALGVAAFGLDLPESRFGWRQVVSAVAGCAAVVGALPVVATFGGGRLDLPSTGYSQVLSWLPETSGSGGAGTLWLGDGAILPGHPWTLGLGLAYTVSTEGIPDLTSVWQAPPTSSDKKIADDVSLASRGRTVELGHLLASQGVRYVVVTTALAPDVPGLQTPEAVAPPRSLLRALDLQTDLRELPTLGGYQVYVDPEYKAPTAGASGSTSRTAAAAAFRSPGWLGFLVAVEIVIWVAAFSLLAFLRRRRSAGAHVAGTNRHDGVEPPPSGPDTGPSRNGVEASLPETVVAIPAESATESGADNAVVTGGK